MAGSDTHTIHISCYLSELSATLGRPLPSGGGSSQVELHYRIVPVGSDTASGQICRVPMERDRLFAGVYRKSLHVRIPDGCALAYRFFINGMDLPDPRATQIFGKRPFGTFKQTAYWSVYEGEKVPRLPEPSRFPLRILQTETVAYRLHVRGYTMQRLQKTREKVGEASGRRILPGTFEALAQRLPYLEALGINQLQLLPVYEFFDRDAGGRCSFWGYGGGAYFCVKSAYSSVSDGAASFAAFVANCHKRGIEVILMTPFFAGVPYSLVRDCLLYYSCRFGVDGFIVDPFYVPVASLLRDPFLSDRKILCDDRTFTRSLRYLLKGDGPPVPALWQSGQKDGEPGLCHMVCDHNTMTLRDLVSYNRKHNEGNGEGGSDGSDEPDGWNCGVEGKTASKAVKKRRSSQMQNALLLLLLCGPNPCLYGGDEWGNTQEGNNNAYCHDDPVGWIDRPDKGVYGYLTAFVKRVVHFRRNRDYFSNLHTPAKGQNGFPGLSVHGPLPWTNPTDGLYTGILMAGQHGRLLYIACQMNWEKETFYLPRPPAGYIWRELDFTKRSTKRSRPIDSSCPLRIRGRHIRVFETDGKAGDEMEVHAGADRAERKEDR